MRRAALGGALAAILGIGAHTLPLAAGDGDGPPDSDRPAPHLSLSGRPSEYAGPGRDDGLPSDLHEIRIAWFGPSDPNHAEGGGAWVAAGMAIDETNATGGYRGIPFRLVPVWSDNPWTGGAASLARLAASRDVLAIAGSLDGPSAHLAEQIAVKARVTFVNSSSTDRTVNLANVPWVFSIPPPDDLLAAALARHIAETLHAAHPTIEPETDDRRASTTDRPGLPAASESDPTRVRGRAALAIISATDHDSHAATTEILRALERLGVAPTHHLEFEPGAAGARAVAARVADLDPGGVVIVAGASDSARVLVALREQEMDIPIFGGPSMGRRAFLEETRSAAEGVVFPLTCDPAAAPPGPVSTFEVSAATGANLSSEPEAGERFARAPESDRRLALAPDCLSIQAYDAVRLVVEAIRRAGPNRARIRDAVRDLSPWPGASGPIRWTNLNQNDRTGRSARVQGGAVVPP